MSAELKPTKEFLKIMDTLSNMDGDELRRWERIRDEAIAKVAYWQRQVEHSSALAIRFTMESWAEEANPPSEKGAEG